MTDDVVTQSLQKIIFIVIIIASEISFSFSKTTWNCHLPADTFAENKNMKRECQTFSMKNTLYRLVLINQP